MPTYVYKFIETGETIEVQQSFTEDALTEAVHPARGETMAVKKVFLPVGVTFKGGGFYKTDSRKSSDKSDKSTDKSDKSDKSSSGSSSDSSGSSGASTGTSESSGSSGSSDSASTSTPTKSTPTKSSAASD